jgi:C4-dicarboxylate transporter DctQ subunit
MHTEQVSADLELPKWIVYACIPLGSYLMCYRFLQVAWRFHHTGHLPHADHGHVEGLDKEDATVWAKLETDLHPADVDPSVRPGGKQ